MSATDIILIAGPTASGKSALALELAAALGGTIINADSMQVYRDLRIITARPAPEEEASAPHRLYGHVDAAENYSVGRWRVDAAEALAAAKQESLPAILVGEGVAALHAELSARDAAGAARLMPGDRARVTRALEVVLATGRPLLDWHEDNTPASVDLARAAKIFLMPDREELFRRIDARFDAMIAAGALDEVSVLATRNLDPNLPAMKAHGVPWLIRHLRREIALAEAVEHAKLETRQYTKRQATWFRNQLPEFEWAEPRSAHAAVEAQLRTLSG